MAQSLQTLRNSSIKRAHPLGRNLGIDRDGYLVGAPSFRGVVEDLNTASTGTDVLPYGVARVITSGSTSTVQFNLAAPVPGVRKVLCITSTSTGSNQFLTTPNGAAVACGSDGTTRNCVNLRGPGGMAVLEALTTALWALVGFGGYSSTGLAQNVTVTTSTA